MGEVGVEGLARRRGDVGQSTHLGHGFSLAAWKVDIGDLCLAGNDGHIDPDQVPGPALPLSHCTDMRSGWDKAPDN